MRFLFALLLLVSVHAVYGQCPNGRCPAQSTTCRPATYLPQSTCTLNSQPLTLFASNSQPPTPTVGTQHVVYRDAQGRVLWEGAEPVGSAPLVYASSPQSTPIVAVPMADCSTGRCLAPVRNLSTTINNTVQAVGGAIDGLLGLHNRERAAHGLPPLRYDPGLSSQSLRHSQQQANARSMHHSKGGFAAENVAAGQRSEQEVVRDWMNSPGHRKNILDPNLSTVGFGQVTGPDGRIYWTAQFGRGSTERGLPTPTYELVPLPYR